MQINPISNTNPNFQAKFVMDNRGILKNAYKNETMTDSAKKLLYKFSRMGKGQEVEFANRSSMSFPFYFDEIEIFNRTTGKTANISKGIGEKFWDKVLKTLVEDESFFKPNDLWQELTGQKVVTWIKK